MVTRELGWSERLDGHEEGKLWKGFGHESTAALGRGRRAHWIDSARSLRSVLLAIKRWLCKRRARADNFREERGAVTSVIAGR